MDFQKLAQVIEGQDQVEQLPLSIIRVNPFQPRKVFDDEALQELSDSIQEHGVLQPIVVRKKVSGYEIVVGERRFRASKRANKTHIPAIVRELTDQQMQELAILENLQREDLTPIEEAEAYQSLMHNLHFTQEELAVRLGKSRPHIANHIRLLSLPADVREAITSGKLSMGHGRSLLGLRIPRQMSLMAQRVMKEGLSVRQLEKIVQERTAVSRGTKALKQKNIFVQEREAQLRDALGTNVQIQQSKHKGKIEIEFYSDEDLERILALLQLNDIE
ncbi:MAG: ParB/RepB/Spo0J family partition protein [Caryophanon sp.]|nr:ParB/RepB/Spo0J family partition protein [Caryophanon sp.]